MACQQRVCTLLQLAQSNNFCSVGFTSKATAKEAREDLNAGGGGWHVTLGPDHFRPRPYSRGKNK